MYFHPHTYVEHTLNKSPSKATYTFSRAERFSELPPKASLKAFSPQRQREKISPYSKPTIEREVIWGQSASKSKSKSRNKSNSPIKINEVNNKSVGKYKKYKQQKIHNPYEQLMSKNKRYKKHDNSSLMHVDLGGWPESKKWFQSDKNKSKSITKNKSMNRLSPDPVPRASLSRSPSFTKVNPQKKMQNEKQQQIRKQRIQQKFDDPIGPGTYETALKRVGQYPQSRYKNNPKIIFSKSPTKRESYMLDKKNEEYQYGAQIYQPFSQFGN